MVSDMRERYHRAAALTPQRLYGLMRNRWVQPHWTGHGDVFWYRRELDGDRHEFVLVDPEAPGQRTLLSDQAELDAELLRVLGGDRAVVEARAGVLPSPDGRHELFRRDHDIWLRDTATAQERPLTTTGEPYYSWGALPDNNNVHIPMKRAGTVLPPVLTAFSPSGRVVVTARVDEREASEWPFVEHLPADRARPRLHQIRGTLDDEQVSGEPQLAFLDTQTGKEISVTGGVDLLGGFLSAGVDALTWGQDEESVYLLSHSPGQSRAVLWRIDVATGDRQAVVSETADPLYEPNTHLYSLPLIRVLPSSNEAIWFSQRDGWGHLYRYDLRTGECLNQISTGNLVVRDILRVDEDQREVLFLAGCGDNGHNPYWRKLYRARLDGTDQVLLTPEPVDHEMSAPVPQFFAVVFGSAPASGVSPSGRYVIDHMSTVGQSPRIVLRETRTGTIITELERTDVSRLMAAGYRPPEQFRVKTQDGQADIWGVITVPGDLGPDGRAPVIDLIYAGFQMATQPTSFLGGGALGGRSDPWAAAASVAYAALGFATVILDGRGTPGRDRAFRQWTHGHPDTPRGLEDHVAAITALASRYPVDTGRVGLTGHSYGGYNSARAMLMFPGFFKVGVSSAGVHVPEKMPKGSWGWHIGADTVHDSAVYRALGNTHLADRLAGKLLLLFGELDENATLDHTLALADAFIRAGKRFDMKLWPGVDHYRTTSGYIAMVVWDYFVEHLLGETPPADFKPADA